VTREGRFAPPAPVETALAALAENRRLDPVVRALTGAIERRLPTGAPRDVLHGVWLGHPLHPLLTDLPIGAWTSATLLDLFGGRQSARGARTLVGFGCLAAVPTAVSGATDWSRTSPREGRVGLVHAAANTVALGLYAWSWRARRRGRRGRGVLLGLAGAAAATVGGHLGGHLAYRLALGANRAADVVPPSEWTESRVVRRDGDVRLVTVGDQEALVLDGSDVAVGARCSHLGGPLGEGDVVGRPGPGAGGSRCVVCPWHGSAFDLRDGTVVHGPATAPQPTYAVDRGRGPQPWLRGRAR
jgi:nitrite reductase/ring-hydroxylating ferredoxin subunit/uncharacterized membrane protein